jgi:putative RNA 2'-phosphotransferase
MEDNYTGISKFLSLVLRHDPAVIGLQLNEGGWASVAELLEKLHSNGQPLSFEALETIVATNNKKRFAFNENKTMIRASQGHSVSVDLALLPATPPACLFHGTVQRNMESINKEGLRPMKRRHVHLTAWLETASTVAARHGTPLVLEVASSAMHKNGYIFYLSDNDVWLTDAVPPEYISVQGKDNADTKINRK